MNPPSSSHHDNVLGNAVVTSHRLTKTWPCKRLWHHTTPLTPRIALATTLKFQQAGMRWNSDITGELVRALAVDDSVKNTIPRKYATLISSCLNFSTPDQTHAMVVAAFAHVPQKVDRTPSSNQSVSAIHAETNERPVRPSNIKHAG